MTIIDIAEHYLWTAMATKPSKKKHDVKKKGEEEWKIKKQIKPPDDPLLQCLIILTKMYHHPYTNDALTGGLPLVDGKLTPEVFIRAADRAGFSSKLVAVPLAEITPMSLPAVLLLSHQKACIIERLDKQGNAYIIEPESGGGLQRISIEKLQENYIGNVLYIRPQYRFDQRTQHIGEETEQHWFWGTLFKFYPIYSEVLAASFVINLFALASPLFIMNVYDRVVPNNAIETLWVLAIGVSTVFIFDFIMRTLRGYFIDAASKNIDVKLSAQIFEQVLGVKMAERPPSVGSLANTVSAFEAFRDFITSASISVLIDLPFTLIFISVIWIIGGNLAIIPLLVIPVVILIGYLIQIPLNKLVEESYRFAAEKHATLIESLTGIETIKSTAAESPMQRRWERIICLSANLGARLRFLSNIATNFATFSQLLASVMVVIAGVYKISNGDITMGALIACTILTGRALAPMAQVASLITRYKQSVTALHSVNNLMSMDVEKSHELSPLHRESFKGEIEFKKVSFSYPEQPIQALTDVSFKLKAGERVGIIGRIGSGKSTLEKLIMRLYQPTSGSVLIDGTEVNQLDTTELRHNIGYVSQDIMLFFGSVKDNIVMGAPYVDDNVVLRAALISGVDEFIRIHPQGFDLQVGERGTNLSGGQRQAIAMARAVLLNPPIILLDEPTSSMDDKTEAHIKARLTPFLKNKTLVLVTHRGSMLSLVDRLILLDSGQVIADGPKDAILTALKEGKIKTKS